MCPNPRGYLVVRAPAKTVVRMPSFYRNFPCKRGPNTYWCIYARDVFARRFELLFSCSQALDLWSLGCTLYAFVFGKLPFYDESVLTLYNMIKTEPVVFPETQKVSDSLKDLILRLLDKDPSSRITLPEIKVRKMVQGCVWSDQGPYWFWARLS